LRAILVGCAIGTLLAAGNVYTSIKTGYIDGGSISAAILGFTFFAVFRRRGSAPYSVAENNITRPPRRRPRSCRSCWAPAGRCRR